MHIAATPHIASLHGVKKIGRQTEHGGGDRARSVPAWAARARTNEPPLVHSVLPPSPWT
jgi:hypothetical protein